MITKAMPALDAAINEESWEWLKDNLPTLATAVAEEVERGAGSKEIHFYVMKRTQRAALAARCEQAAQYLIVEDGDR